MSAPQFKLTSTAIPMAPNGNFPYHQKGLLVPHEFVRREFIRLEMAIKNFDAVTHPWKAYCLHEWIAKFFIPSIHEHHDLEEHLVFPYYTKLGTEVPPKQAADHVTLLKMLKDLDDLTAKILESVKINDADAIRSNTTNMTNLFQELQHHMLFHLEEEEHFWPGAFEKYGEVSSIL